MLKQRLWIYGKNVIKQDFYASKTFLFLRKDKKILYIFVPMNDTNEIKVGLSCPTAKYLLKELLSDDYLLKDKEIIELLNSALQKNKESMICSTYSTIIIDEHCRIFMPEYSHKEIKMPYLPKTVYLFFLLFEGGSEFKNLYNYKEQLYHIYQVVSKEKNLESEKLKRSLENLVEPLNNRIYEICSLIRRELACVVPEDLLEEYAITGKWGGLHQIRLERSYLQMHEEIAQKLQIRLNNCEADK